MGARAVVETRGDDPARRVDPAERMGAQETAPTDEEPVAPVQGSAMTDPAKFSVRVVPCTVCGKMIERKTQFSRAKCPGCYETGRVDSGIRTLRSVREQARRYRVLLHISGYSDAEFAELVAELKKTSLAFRTEPEGVQARRDFKRERIRHER